MALAEMSEIASRKRCSDVNTKLCQEKQMKRDGQTGRRAEQGYAMARHVKSKRLQFDGWKKDAVARGMRRESAKRKRYQDKELAKISSVRESDERKKRFQERDARTRNCPKKI